MVHPFNTRAARYKNHPALILTPNNSQFIPKNMAAVLKRGVALGPLGPWGSTRLFQPWQGKTCKGGGSRRGGTGDGQPFLYEYSYMPQESSY